MEEKFIIIGEKAAEEPTTLWLLYMPLKLAKLLDEVFYSELYFSNKV